MTDPTRRVEQLIALATDPAATEQEARTAAHSACKEIRKNDLVVAPRGSSSPQTAQVAPRPQRTKQLAGRPPAGLAAPPLPEQRQPMHHVVDFDFKDAPQAKREEFAFPQHLFRK